MDYQEALTMALAKEKAAVKLYKKFSADHPEIRELFDFLANEEEKHAILIQKKIADLYKIF